MATRHLNGATAQALREALGAKLKEVAEDAGITESYLSRLENGKQQPKPHVIRALADRLGVSVDAITYPVPDSAEPAEAMA